jgi:RecA-family ATPase
VDGREWLGRTVQQGAVLYVALERKKLVERRAIAFRERHAISDALFAIVGGVFDFRNPQKVASVVETARQVEDETGETLAERP